MTDTKPKIAVVLSGCGVFDGAEIHESVLTLLALDRHGADYECYAPNMEQAHVVNHLSGGETAETRNVLVESARIARGDIKDLKDFDAGAVDAVIFPGGYGAAKNLCTFAIDGPGCSVNGDVERAVRGMAAAKKPIGALCISPALVARILDNAQVTIGQDAETATAIKKMGGRHKPAAQGEIVVDRNLGLVTTPCYMLGSTISQVAEDAENTVKAVLDLIKEGRVEA
ncbi:MAG TPA: isoprenoid biosynthesis glyoxalase ElbB [Rhodospirillales bacterium]|jgi:enhancing lycopene biosynthesis protein 2|nr:isoprenoid biosynthesis protein ElbB [Rhodospirillaceae bacterium]HJN23108.1 isoprenoid biosynthesis glyoxalase ElbB [Rhodospirillales bacterium]